MNYTVMVYDESNTVVAKMENATSPTYSRSKNSADQISFSVPTGDTKIPELAIGRRFEIVRFGGEGISNVFEASGYISEVGYSRGAYDVSGFTEEIILSKYLTPYSYGYPLWSEYATLNDFFDQIGRRYEVVRIKGDWDSYDEPLESLDVDFASNPEFVLLQGAPTGEDGATEYPLTTGYITFRFQKSADEEWERIRWVSDYDEKAGVTTTVQYRQGSTPGSGSWSPATAGALTDIVGIVPSSFTDEYMDVRVNFDTTSVETSPVLYSLEVVKSSLIEEIDTITYEAGASAVITPNITADGAPLLDVVIDVCEQAGWEFKLEKRTLEFAETLGTSRVNTYSLVES